MAQGDPGRTPPLPWHQAAWERIGHQIEEGTLPHALLVSAPAHTGKTRFATALARRLLCESPESGVNCGRCRACELAAAGNHGDLRWLAPEGKSQSIKVDSVRDVVAYAGKTAGMGRAKVIVFAPAEAMNVNAANALLKCLEEPAANTYLILLSAQPHRIPATVRSRCQQVRLAPPGSEQSLEWLDVSTGSRAESEKWLDLSGGMPLLAEQLLLSPDAEALIAGRVACDALLRGKVGVGAAVQMLESSDFAQALEQVAGTIRDHLRSADRAELQGRRGRALFALLDEVSRTLRALHSGANPNRQLVCEVILEKLHFLLGQPNTGASIS